jgi:hypothetical protein
VAAPPKRAAPRCLTQARVRTPRQVSLALLHVFCTITTIARQQDDLDERDGAHWRSPRARPVRKFCGTRVVAVISSLAMHSQRIAEKKCHRREAGGRNSSSRAERECDCHGTATSKSTAG